MGHHHEHHDHQHAHCHCDDHHDSGGCMCHSVDSHQGLVRQYLPEAVSLALLLIGAMLGWLGVFGSVASACGMRPWLPELAYYLVAVSPVAVPILRESAELWRHGDVMNEFTLMVLAAAGAFAIGEYPEAVAVLLFYSFGEKLQSTASDDVRQRIRSLISKMPQGVTLADGTVAAPETVEVGTTIVVKPGERIPIDGILTAAMPVDMDTSALTGESVPRSYAPGQEVSAGIIPIDREVSVRTSRAFADSTLSRMMRMIDDASAAKTPTETMLRRITRWFTPTVVTLAVLVFVVPWLVAAASGSPFDAMMWIKRALVFFVCACPCALVVSIPLCYFASLGNAARRGLLFKGATHIDAMRDIDIVAFDKTGTITTGRFHVVDIAADDADRVLALAAAVDAHSTHPLAVAIVAEAAGRSLPLPAVGDIATIPHGMVAHIDSREIIVGSRHLLASRGIAVTAPASDLSEICVALGGTHIGSIYLEDTVKPEAADAVSALHGLGIASVVILSGDRADAVAKVAAAVNANNYHGELLPADKYQAIEQLKADGHRVAFVGDGINDAPSIAAATVGIAMGTLGTDMAMESADVVVAGDNLSKIAEGISLSHRVRRVVMENIVFAFGVKATVMALAAFGIATLWAGVFADTGVTLLTILWTLLRLKK